MANPAAARWTAVAPLESGSRLTTAATANPAPATTSGVRLVAAASAKHATDISAIAESTNARYGAPGTANRLTVRAIGS